MFDALEIEEKNLPHFKSFETVFLLQILVTKVAKLKCFDFI